MTLSRFLRDYLYIPLGGSRHGLPVQMYALLVTMALGGLWHGAGWNFLIWGVLHGLALAVGVLWRRAMLPMPSPIGWVLTFAFVTFTWIFFRSSSLTGAMNIISGLGAMPGLRIDGLRTIAIAAFCAIALPPSHIIVARLTQRPSPAMAAAFACASILILVALGHRETHEFIYFQF
jgi:hypothetical protein